MNTLVNKFLLMSIVLTCTFTSTHTIGDQRYLMQDAEGFCMSLPMVENPTLTQRIRDWQTVLEAQRKILAERIEQLKFNSVDTIITLVMPGGLLYAAVKRSNQLERRENLALLTADLQQLDGDLNAFQSFSNLQLAVLQN
ncbi:MAG: hypothetical protein QNJ78_01880 [Gammaproteobacteria bacterium]|nr:hypothetical protein [Gammaproteobacteria bacterium]